MSDQLGALQEAVATLTAENAALKAENERRRAAGEPEKLPEENYYGWLVNDKLPELHALF